MIEEDFRVFNKLDENLRKMEDKTSIGKSERTFTVTGLQGEPHELGIRGLPIFVKMDGLVCGEDEGMLITNGQYVLYVDEIGKSGFTKLYMYASGIYESIPEVELRKPFFELC